MNHSKNHFAIRRTILKYLGAILFLFPLKLLYSMVKQRIFSIKKNNSFIQIRIDQLNKISIIDNIIIIKNIDGFLVYSARCSHLGCIIKKTDNNELVCPCHGSRFSLNGNVIKGPATGKLTTLDYKIDHKKGILIVETFI